MCSKGALAVGGVGRGARAAHGASGAGRMEATASGAGGGSRGPREGEALEALRRGVVPRLGGEARKGDAGRVAVVGGCREYTGAPYFCAEASLRAGADLAHVFCTPAAAAPLKGYSPELIMHPDLPEGAGAPADADAGASKRAAETWFGRLDALALGPGLGRDPAVQRAARDMALAWHSGIGVRGDFDVGTDGPTRPLVLDGDGLQLALGLLEHDAFTPSRWCVLTPNPNEYRRLLQARNLDEAQLGEEACARALAEALGGVTVVRKGREDIISDGESVLRCTEPGSPRRCGGTGDVLAGVTVTFLAWARKAHASPLVAAYGACLVTRRAARRAFSLQGRGTLAQDVLGQVGQAFDEFFPAAEYWDP